MQTKEETPKEKGQANSHKRTFTLKFHRFIKRSGEFFSELLFPSDIKCIFCGADVPDFENKPYCEDCEKTLPFNNSHRCEICDQPIYSEATVCDFCQKEKRNFKKAFCPFLYEGEVKNAILGYKESNQRFKARTFARLMTKRIEEAKVKIDYISYVPLTEKKEKQRSFNQSKLLAEEIGKILEVPVLCLFEKNRDDTNQKRLNFKERRENVIGLYSLKPAKLSKFKNLLIVDDVMTTGSTIGYLSGLVRPRVKDVYVAAIAREIVREQKPQGIRLKKHTFSFNAK